MSIHQLENKPRPERPAADVAPRPSSGSALPRHMRTNGGAAALAAGAVLADSRGMAAAGQLPEDPRQPQPPKITVIGGTALQRIMQQEFIRQGFCYAPFGNGN